MSEREELLALLPEPLRSKVAKQLARADALDVPLGHCVACGERVERSKVWLLLQGGLEAHGDCEAAANILVPPPVLFVEGRYVKALPMRMHPPTYSTVELPPQTGPSELARAFALVHRKYQGRLTRKLEAARSKIKAVRGRLR